MAKKRKDINTLSQDELADYIHALDVLRARSAQNPDDETGYAFQAGLHNDQFIGPCEHGSDLFLPWHRAHLHYFEQLLQQADPPRTSNVTIPYWDWLHGEENGAKFPLAFTRPGLFEEGRNEKPTPLPPDTLAIVVGERDWNEFGGYPREDPDRNYGRLELGPHNYMHPEFIGGKMASASTAAEDAIYFSFHCFIDLLWAEWQRRNAEPAPTSPQADLRGFLTKPRHKVADFQHPTELDYEYEYTERLKEAFEISSPPAQPQALLAATPLRPLFADSVEAELRQKSRLGFAFPSPPAAPLTALVRLRDLKIPTTGSYRLRAFVYPQDVPFDRDDAAFQEHYYVGYISLWRAHETHGAHGGHSHHHEPLPHHPTACTARFDVTKVVRGLAPAAVSDLMLTLEYIPAPSPTGEPLAVPELLKEVKLKDVLMEVYG